MDLGTASLDRSEVESDDVADAAPVRVELFFLEGELDVRALSQLCGELTLRLSRGTRNVVLDFDEVPHLDYRGVKLLLERTEAFRRAGGDVKLSGLSGYLGAILRAAGAYDSFECYPHPAAARAAFQLAAAACV